MWELTVEVIRYELPICYVDGEIANFRVVVRNADGSFANTGREFEHLRQAEAFAEGIRTGIHLLGPRARAVLVSRTDIDDRRFEPA